jgi:hypothetical protein
MSEVKARSWTDSSVMRKIRSDARQAGPMPDLSRWNTMKRRSKYCEGQKLT